jgi:UDP-N-acetylmuramoylalanine--D-glutamate ligase
VENVLAAIAATDVLGVDPDAMSAAVRSFRPAPHRLQLVAEQAGVRYIDDSIATSPARAIVALQAIDAPVILIAGGRDKRLPWDDFARVVARRVRALLLIGEAADDIEAAVRTGLAHESGALSPDAMYHYESLDSAVDAARKMARPGDVVLLSPACTSYDMFRDFEERGQLFARAVSRVYAA